MNLEAQLSLLNQAVAVNNQPQRSVGNISIAHDLNVPAAVELSFIFDQRGGHLNQSHVRIVQPSDAFAGPGMRLTHTPVPVTLAYMLIDMHTHTSVYSTDSNLLPHEALARAAERGIDGVILTEHDVVWAAERAARLAEQVGIVVLPGVEVTTELGHVLVYGLASLVLAGPGSQESAKTLRSAMATAHSPMMISWLHPPPEYPPACASRELPLEVCSTARKA